MRRKSAQQQINSGDPRKRGVHQLDAALEAEPKTVSGLPMTTRLRGDAKLIYEFFAEQLDISNLAAMPDGPALERAAVNLALCWRCDKMLARGAVQRVPILAGPRGARRIIGHREVKSKWFSVRLESEKQFLRFASRFGITGPSSRAGLEAVSPGNDDKLWELLSKPRHDIKDPKPDEPTQ